MGETAGSRPAEIYRSDLRFRLPKGRVPAKSVTLAANIYRPFRRDASERAR